MATAPEEISEVINKYPIQGMKFNDLIFDEPTAKKILGDLVLIPGVKIYKDTGEGRSIGYNGLVFAYFDSHTRKLICIRNALKYL